MIRNSYRKHGWTFPGGGIKKGESSKNAAKREVQEEIGVQLKNIKSHGNFLSTLEGKKDTIWVFSSKLKDKSFKTDNLEIAEAKWVEIDQLYSNKLSLGPIARKCLKQFPSLK